MKQLTTTLLLFTILFFLHSKAYADVRLPAVISSGMVLQQKSNTTLWGWCEPNEKITIKVGWDTATYTTNGNANAKWMVQLKTPAAGGPYQVFINGNNNITLNDVMIGEVWVCSGQSNMEMSVAWGIKYYDADVAAATNKNIRFFAIPKTTSEHPQDDVTASWVQSNPETMRRFSAVAYFFGKKLSEELNVPVGLIHASWGGTPAEVWTPEEVVAEKDILADAAKKINVSKYWPVTPGYTYNAMIHPLTKLNIAGAIWYQGETNVGTASTYNQLFSSMIAAWRKAFNQPVPFYFVQIAPYAGYGKSGNSSAFLREAQAQTLQVPNTGMVVTTDLVHDINDIHPHNKKDVGLRLANYALGQTYGKQVGAYKSPMYKSMEVDKKEIRLQFQHADDGFTVKGKSPDNFYIAGEDKIFVPAQAKVDGNEIIVWSKEVKEPVAVRFGFANNATPNLFGKNGLPVAPFRTDNWNVDTVQPTNDNKGK